MTDLHLASVWRQKDTGRMNDREIDFIRTALLGKNPIVEIGHSRTAQRNSSIGVVEQKSGIDKADDFFNSGMQ